jgi:hypothetical protein
MFNVAASGPHFRRKREQKLTLADLGVERQYGAAQARGKRAL